MSKFIVMDACYPAKASWKWHHRYRRVAVVEIEDGFNGRPKMISTHARGVVRVVRIWEPMYVGETDRCEFSRAVQEADAMAEELNHENRT